MGTMRRLGVIAALGLVAAVPATAVAQTPTRLTVSPPGVTAQSKVTITAHGLRPGSRVRFMIGPRNSEAVLWTERTIGMRGRAAWVIVLPRRVSPGWNWVAVACQMRCRVTPFTVIRR